MRSLRPCSDSSATPSFPSQPEGKIGLPRANPRGYFLLPSTSLARPSRSLSERTKPVFSSCSHRVELVHRPSRHLPSGHHLLLNPLTPPRLSPRTYTLSSMNLYLPPLCSMLGVEGCGFHAVAQSCPTLSGPMDCSPPGSSVHGIFQARI